MLSPKTRILTQMASILDFGVFAVIIECKWKLHCIPCPWKHMSEVENKIGSLTCILLKLWRISYLCNVPKPHPIVLLPLSEHFLFRFWSLTLSIYRYLFLEPPFWLYIFIIKFNPLTNVETPHSKGFCFSYFLFLIVVAVILEYKW